MNDEMIRRALADPGLSHRALGALLRILSDGSVPSADQLAALGKEGRDAMRAALKELIERGYLATERTPAPRSESGWKTVRVITEPLPQCGNEPLRESGYSATGSGLRERGFPARQRGISARERGFSGVNSHSSYSSQVESPTSPSGEVALSRAQGARIEEEVVVSGWDGLFDRTEKPEPKSPRPSRDDARAKRAARRTVKPYDQWTALDISEEFAARVKQSVPVERQIGQVGTVELAKILGSFIRDGRIQPAQGAHLVDLFFGDPRNLNRVGFDQPLWRRFVAAIPSLNAMSRSRAGLDQAPEITVEILEDEAQDALRRLS